MNGFVMYLYTLVLCAYKVGIYMRRFMGRNGVLHYIFGTGGGGPACDENIDPNLRSVKMMGQNDL